MKVGEDVAPPPFEWQTREDCTNGDAPKRMIAASPRLGKTLAMARTLRRRAPSRTLVVAPLKVAPVWRTTLESVGLPTIPLYDLTNREINAMFAGRAKNAWEGVAIVNRDKLADVWERFDGVQGFVADESHNFAANRSNRGKAYRALARRAPFVRALTGTPVPKNYGSLWGQLQPFDPEGFGSSYGSFAQRFLITEPMFGRVLGHRNVDELQRLVLGVTSVYRREDVWGPDQYQIIRRDVDMPEKAWKAYHRMARESILAELNLEAANAGVRLMRLQQITSGIVPKFDEAGERDGDELMHTEKIDALVEDLGDIVASDEKLVVFHRFVAEGALAVGKIRARFGDDVPIWTVNGQERVKADEHYRRTEAFNAHDGAAVCVVQIQSGSEGISLRGAQHLAYLSRSYSFTEDEQSRDRVFAPGQTRTISYYDVPGTVDDFVWDIITSKRTLHDAIRNVDRESLAYGPIMSRRKKK